MRKLAEIVITIFILAYICNKTQEFFYLHIVSTHRGTYVESDLKFIKTYKHKAYFESVLGMCAIENYKQQYEVGDIINGYHSLEKPHKCFSQEEFLIIDNRENNIIYITSYILSILITTILFIPTFVIYCDVICKKYDNQINEFFDPKEERIKKLENKYDKLHGSMMEILKILNKG